MTPSGACSGEFGRHPGGRDRRRLPALRRLAALVSLVLLGIPAPAASWALTGAVGAHDPTIIKEGNTWWCFTTGTGLPVKYSADGLNWTQGVQLFSTELSWWRTYASQMGHLDVWAPDVHFFAGRFWCYYCVSEFGTNNSAIGLESCSSIALGDWRDDGLVLSSKSGVQTFNALDPDLTIDAAGHPWLVFGSYFDGIHVVQLDPATMKPTGALTSIAVRANGIEGCNIVRAHGYYYLFASIDQCCMGVNSTYKIAFGRSTSITGPYADQGNGAMLSGGGTVLDSSGPRWKGPGGESVDQNGNDWIIAFHAYDANNSGAPTLQISDLYWDADGWPTFAGPIAPAFTVQPAGQTVTAGYSVSFTLTATGSPDPTFQWQKDGSPIGGATGSSYTIAVTTPADAGTYTAVATNAGGSVTSGGAVLVVNPANTAPAFSAQPVDQIVVAGKATTLAVVASGNPAPSFQWARKAPGSSDSWTVLVDGGVYSGTTTAALTLSAVAGGMSGDQFTCTATNSVGSATSNPATLTVLVPSADFNGDGQSDLFWQNTVTGERSTWLMNGPSQIGSASFGTIPTGWSVAAVADFNGHGQYDLLWQNAATGERSIWLMAGASFVSSVNLGVIPIEWSIAGAGDFDGDGQPDIIWENTATGERLVWLMNGPADASSVSLGVVPTNWSISGVADFDRDGHTDIIWTNTTTGERLIWLMNGVIQTGAATLGIIPADLQISGVGDYNGDRWPDLLMTNTATGERSIWLMNGATHVGTVSLGIVSLDWVLGRPVAKPIQLAKLDFNSDGQADLLWENTATGEHYIWFMNGTNLVSSAFVGMLAPEWRIAATGDFNSDGQPDVVWENTSTGERFLWLMNGTNFAAGVSPGVMPVEWHIAATGDFNGDGRTDLVWENTTTGEHYVWLMSGTTFVSSVSLGVLPIEWRIAATGDFNSDGQPDLVWQNTTTGERYVWLMNGTSFAASISLGSISTDWSIAAAADFNGDGKPDLVWENTSTGERYVWLMNGTTFQSSVSLGVISTDWHLRN
jgi:arabinan endo-1,5-alpha-L-arabinosidase